MGNTKGAKQRGREFWESAVGRLRGGAKAKELAQELGVDVGGLYRWRQRLDGAAVQDPARQREVALKRENEGLKRALAERVMEVDFLRGALHRIEARRQGSGSSGAKASTTRSGK